MTRRGSLILTVVLGAIGLYVFREITPVARQRADHARQLRVEQAVMVRQA